MKKIFSIVLLVLSGFVILGACTPPAPPVEVDSRDYVGAALEQNLINYAVGDSALSVTQDITLVTSVSVTVNDEAGVAKSASVAISWTSSSEVISASGVVTRTTEEADVQLTAKASYLTKEATKQYDLKVIALDPHLSWPTAWINEKFGSSASYVVPFAWGTYYDWEEMDLSWAGLPSNYYVYVSGYNSQEELDDYLVEYNVLLEEAGWLLSTAFYGQLYATPDLRFAVYPYFTENLHGTGEKGVEVCFLEAEPGDIIPYLDYFPYAEAESILGFSIASVPDPEVPLYALADDPLWALEANILISFPNFQDVNFYEDYCEALENAGFTWDNNAGAYLSPDSLYFVAVSDNFADPYLLIVDVVYVYPALPPADLSSFPASEVVAALGAPDSIFDEIAVPTTSSATAYYDDNYAEVIVYDWTATDYDNYSAALDSSYDYNYTYGYEVLPGVFVFIQYVTYPGNVEIVVFYFQYIIVPEYDLIIAGISADLGYDLSALPEPTGYVTLTYWDAEGQGGDRAFIDLVGLGYDYISTYNNLLVEAGYSLNPDGSYTDPNGIYSVFIYYDTWSDCPSIRIGAIPTVIHGIDYATLEAAGWDSALVAYIPEIEADTVTTDIYEDGFYILVIVGSWNEEDALAYAAALEAEGWYYDSSYDEYYHVSDPTEYFGVAVIEYEAGIYGILFTNYNNW
ncbi:MAG: hypothetical protein LBV55_00565 [Acholeplasmatales bacterium]|jgi:hypothetical protein|nr:hypothetical protein [Acholeplasmatales bacterium]